MWRIVIENITVMVIDIISAYAVLNTTNIEM